jgi:hypothetical protein
MDQLRRPEPVSRTLSACSFGFFSPEEVRCLRTHAHRAPSHALRRRMRARAAEP